MYQTSLSSDQVNLYVNFPPQESKTKTTKSMLIYPMSSLDQLSLGGTNSHKAESDQVLSPKETSNRLCQHPWIRIQRKVTALDGGTKYPRYAYFCVNPNLCDL